MKKIRKGQKTRLEMILVVRQYTFAIGNPPILKIDRILILNFLKKVLFKKKNIYF